MKREIPTDELAEAERYARTGAASRPPHELLSQLVAEYDRRGAIEQRAREELDRTSNHAVWSVLVDILEDQ